MANKKISELAVRTPSLTDLMLVGDPSTGYSYKATLSALSTLLEANIALDDLNDVTITSPTAGQVLSYNGTAWVNGTNGITGSGSFGYIPKFTSSSAIGNSVLYEDGFSLGLGTTAPTPIATGFRSLTINGTNRAYVSLQVSGADLGYFYVVPSTRVELSSQTALPLVFSTNATERMRLDASGNLGLGTTTFPTFSNTTQLVVRGGIAPSIIQSVSNDKGSSITLYSGNNSSDNPAVIYQKDLRFASVTDDGLTGYSERMRLTASGNLGLGVTPSAWGSSAKAIQVGGFSSFANDGNGAMNITSNAYESATNTWNYITSLGASRYRQSFGDHAWFTASSGTAGNAITFTQAMTLDASGRLGIGTTSPTYKLEVNNAARVGNSSGGIILSGDGGSGNIWTDIASPLRLGANNAEYMRITSGGNVGIGTSVPINLAGYTNVTIGGGSTNYGQLTWNNSTTAIGYAYNDATNMNIGSDGALIFRTTSSATERMRITSGGDVLIGKTSSYRNGKLVVASANVVQNSNTANFHVTTTDTQGADIGGSIGLGGQVGSDESPFGVIAGRKENSTSGNYAGYLVFSTGDGGASMLERMRITSYGELLINTTSDAGDYKLQVNGNVYMSGGTLAPLFTLKAGTTGQAVGTFDISGFSENRVALAVIGHASQAYNYFQIGKSSADDILKVTSAGNLELGGSIKTAAPSGGTAKPFKIGAAATVTPTSQNRTIEIEIDGTTYYLTAKTTND